MTKDKQIEVLDNGTEIKTTKDGWDKATMADIPAQAAAWKEGAAPHFSVGMGYLKAVADAGLFVLGNYEAGDKSIPVIDAPALTEDILNTYAEAKGLDVQRIRIAGNRTGAKKKLDAITSTLQDLDPKVLEMLEATNPEAFATLMNLQA